MFGRICGGHRNRPTLDWVVLNETSTVQPANHLYRRCFAEFAGELGGLSAQLDSPTASVFGREAGGHDRLNRPFEGRHSTVALVASDFWRTALRGIACSKGK